MPECRRGWLAGWLARRNPCWSLTWPSIRGSDVSGPLDSPDFVLSLGKADTPTICVFIFSFFLTLVLDDQGNASDGFLSNPFENERFRFIGHKIPHHPNSAYMVAFLESSVGMVL